MMIKRSQRHKISNLIDLFSTKNIESHKNIDATTSFNEYCQNNEVSDFIAPASNDLQLGGRAASPIHAYNSNEFNLNETNETHNIHNINFLHQYPGLYDDSTMLLDINSEHFGIFTGISASLSFIPEKYIKKTRAIWNKFMQKVLDDGSDINWKKLILLPLILFDYDNNEILNERKRKYGAKLDKLLIDDWSTFNLGSLSKRTIKTNPISQKGIHAAATRLAEVGEIGKAFKKLKSDRNRVIPSHDVPGPGDTDLTEEQIASIYSYNLDRNDEAEPIVVTSAEIELIILKAKKQVAHGIDHMRYEQLKQLWGLYSNDPTEGDFRKLFTSIINKIVQAQVPPNIVPIFKDIELLALPKGEEDIRPIGLQLILKKNCMRYLLETNQ